MYEIKFDGYRALAFKSGGKVHLRSRNDNDFAERYPAIAKALAKMPDETVLDGEIVALDEAGKPSFNALQNYGSSKPPLLYYVFDVMMLAGKDVTGEPLSKRRELLEKKVLPKLAEPIRYSPALEASLADLVASVKAQGLEGLVAKRKDSKYEPGLRSGAWQKDARQSWARSWSSPDTRPRPRTSTRWSSASTRTASCSMRRARATASRPRRARSCSRS